MGGKKLHSFSCGAPLVFNNCLHLLHFVIYSVFEKICPMIILLFACALQLGRAKQIWYLSPMRAAKVQASLRIHAVSPEPSLLTHTSSESRGTFRQKARSLAPLNGWACAVKICHDGMLEDTNSFDGAHLKVATVEVTKVLMIYQRGVI